VAKFRLIWLLARPQCILCCVVCRVLYCAGGGSPHGPVAGADLGRLVVVVQRCLGGVSCTVLCSIMCVVDLRVSGVFSLVRVLGGRGLVCRQCCNIFTCFYMLRAL
jgi:hypothetical protein